MGARPLARVIDNEIKRPLSRELLFGNLKTGGTVTINLTEDSNSLELNCVGEALVEL